MMIPLWGSDVKKCLYTGVKLLSLLDVWYLEVHFHFQTAIYSIW